jgi:hypothetical protein
LKHFKQTEAIRMTIETANAATKLALLIDGDNVSATHMPIIMQEAEKHGGIAVRRIYGQFKSGRMKSWQKHIDEFDLTPVNVSPLTRGKNATDMKLVIEAMDMLHGRQLDGFCIASSDGDFTPLAARIRANALAVYGFGAKKAPAAYKAEFDRFYECDTLLAGQKKAAPRKTEAKTRPAARVQKPPAAKAAPARQKAAPVPAAVEEAVLSVIDNASEGRALMRSIGNALPRAIPGFQAKTFGYPSTKALVRALPGVAITKVGGQSYVTRKTSA